MQDNLRLLAFFGGLWGGVFHVLAPYAVYRASRRSRIKGLPYAAIAALLAWQMLQPLRLLAAQSPMGIPLGSAISVAALLLLRRRDRQSTKG